MLHGQLHHILIRALAAVALVAACSLAAPALDAARADDAQVTVVSSGGDQQTLSLAALAGSEDVLERAYALRSEAGEGPQVVTGFSLATILAAAGADPYGFSYLEVQRPAGGSVLLSRHQALDPQAFAEGPPVVYAAEGGTGFLRPSSGSGDLNATDSFSAPQGVTIVLRSGSPLQVRAKASPTQTRPGKTVAFSAIVDRAGSGEQLTYSWYFDDGHSATGPNPRHSFAKRGSYDVVVGVTTPGDEAGASAVVTIQVGAPLSGPDRKGGGRVRDPEAPDHGAATGTRGAVPPGPSSESATAPTAAPEPSDELDEDARRASPQAEAGERVRGLLLSSTTEPAPKPAPSPAARSGHLSGDGGGPSLPDTALGLLVAGGLLSAGALAESRGAFLSLSDNKAPRGLR